MESLIQLKQRLKPSMILQIGEIDNQYQIQSQVQWLVLGNLMKIPLGEISQPMLRMNREGRSNIPPERMGRPNGSNNEASDKNGDSHDHGNSPNENRGPGWNRDPPDRRGGRPPRENGNPDGGYGGSDPDDIGDGDDSSSSADSTPPRRRGHRKGIVSLSMFMYYKDLQDH